MSEDLWIEEFDEETFFLFFNFHDNLGTFLYSNSNEPPYDFAVGEILHFDTDKSRKLEPWEIIKYRLLGYLDNLGDIDEKATKTKKE